MFFGPLGKSGLGYVLFILESFLCSSTMYFFRCSVRHFMLFGMALEAGLRQFWSFGGDRGS